MTKKKTKGIDYGKFDPIFIDQVKTVIGEGDRHKYSVSRVYNAYNKAHDKNDKPQTCSSCLRARVNELRSWLKGYNLYAADEIAKAAAVLNVGENPKGARPDDAANLIEMEEGQAVDFQSKDGVKGKVKYADGSNLKAGTYTTKDGDEIAVQPGGKATFKAAQAADDLL